MKCMIQCKKKIKLVARDFLTISFLIFSIIKQTTSLFPWRLKTEPSQDPSLITCRLPTTSWPCPAAWGNQSVSTNREVNITECHQIQQIISLHFDWNMSSFELYWSKSAIIEFYKNWLAWGFWHAPVHHLDLDLGPGLVQLVYLRRV